MPSILRKSKQGFDRAASPNGQPSNLRAAYGATSSPYLHTKRDGINTSSLPPLYARFATTSGDRLDQTSTEKIGVMYAQHAPSSSVQVESSPPPPPTKDRRHSTQPQYPTHFIRHISSATLSPPIQSNETARQVSHEILRANTTNDGRSLNSPPNSFNSKINPYNQYDQTPPSTPNSKQSHLQNNVTEARFVSAIHTDSLPDSPPMVMSPLSGASSPSFYGTHVMAAISPPTRSPQPPSPPPKSVIQESISQTLSDTGHQSTPPTSMHARAPAGIHQPSRSQTYRPTQFADNLPNPDDPAPEPVRRGPLIFPGGIPNATRSNTVPAAPSNTHNNSDTFSPAVQDEWKTLVDTAFANAPARAGRESDYSTNSHNRNLTDRSSEDMGAAILPEPVLSMAPLAVIPIPTATRPHNTQLNAKPQPPVPNGYPVMRGGMPTMQAALPTMRGGLPTMSPPFRSPDKERAIQPYEKRRSLKKSGSRHAQPQMQDPSVSPGQGQRLPSQEQNLPPPPVQPQSSTSSRRQSTQSPQTQQRPTPPPKQRKSQPTPPSPQTKGKFSFLPWKSDSEPVKYATLQKRRQGSGGSVSGPSGVNKRAQGLEPNEANEKHVESVVMPSIERRTRPPTSHASTPPLSGLGKGPRRMNSRESFFASSSRLNVRSAGLTDDEFQYTSPTARRNWAEENAPRPLTGFYGAEPIGPLGPYVDAVNPRYFPLGDFMAIPDLLAQLIMHIPYPNWCSLASTSKAIRSTLDDRALAEVILERYLAGVGYMRWAWGEEPLTLSLKDLGFYMQGVSMPTYLYAQRSRTFIQDRDDASREGIRGLAFSTQAYSRVVARIRAQFEAQADVPVLSNSSSESSIPRTNGNGSHGYKRHSHVRNAQILRQKPPPSTLFQHGRAALLRVFVPSPDGGWLSDASILQCEAQLKRAGLSRLLRPGDIVWDVALGEEGNTGKLIWDGSYLIDLDFTYSPWGDVPHYFHSLAFSPAYFHRILRTGGNGTTQNPVVNIDLSPWQDQIMSNIQLVQDRAPINTTSGAMHNVMQWIHRTSFILRPAVIQTNPSLRDMTLAGTRLPIPGTDLFIDPNWHGTIVIETVGTNEGIDELRRRCSMAGVHRVPSLLVFRLLRERSRPGELWIRTITDKERLL